MHGACKIACAEWLEAGAGEYGEAALRAVELQRSSEEDSGNAALRRQTEQRTVDLLQACSQLPNWHRHC